jgi:ATP-binding cassette subfamily F protein 3
LLDEPTNNLDLDGIKALTNALKDFEGAFIIASHDMAFLQNTVEEVYLISKGVMSRLEGGVDDYKSSVKNSVLTHKKN